MPRKPHIHLTPMMVTQLKKVAVVAELKNDRQSPR
jgi:hypothetical protein